MDDGRAAVGAGGVEQRQERLRRHNGAEHVGAHDGLPPVDGAVAQRRPLDGEVAVDEGAHRIVLRGHGRRHLRHRGHVGEIGDEPPAAAAGGVDGRRGRLPGSRRRIDDDHGVDLTGEGDGHGRADHVTDTDHDGHAPAHTGSHRGSAIPSATSSKRTTIGLPDASSGRPGRSDTKRTPGGSSSSTRTTVYGAGNARVDGVLDHRPGVHRPASRHGPPGDVERVARGAVRPREVEDVTRRAAHAARPARREAPPPSSPRVSELGDAHAALRRIRALRRRRRPARHQARLGAGDLATVDVPRSWRTPSTMWFMPWM